ncbi:hypothetical protein Tco_1274913 [Tanacetum coccineum]
MNPQETEQVIARDELWVPTAERVNISTTNVRLETTVKQKEETFQVVIDVIKNSTCIKAFTISADVPEILMQQFWYTITKIKGSESYEFLLAYKRCVIDAKVFRKILDICPRKEGEDFTEVQNDEDDKRSEEFIEDTLPILLSFTHYGNKTILRVLCIILVILPDHPSEIKVFHNEDGNPARDNIQQALGSYERSHKGVKASANSDIVYFFTSAQDGDPLQDDVRLCLGDDLKKAQDHNQRQVKDESKDHYPKYETTVIWYVKMKEKQLRLSNVSKIIAGQRTIIGVAVRDYRTEELDQMRTRS